jgi:predicted acyltransferase
MNSKSERLVSLDVFRGLTVAGMILVNNPGTRQYVYPALDHATWHGVTPTDLIFPFFLFIVGIAISLSLEKRLMRGEDRKILGLHIFQRSITIFLLGEFMSGFPFMNIQPMIAAGSSYWYIGLLLLFSFSYNLSIIIILYMIFPLIEKILFNHDKRESLIRKKLFSFLTILVLLVAAFPFIFPDHGLSNIRIPGVLQRIAVVYFFASSLFLFFDSKKLFYCIIGLLLIYSAFMLLYPVPGFGSGNFTKEGNFAGYLDNLILNGHMWSVSKTWDPEGVFSTLPAIATALFGILTGKLLRSDKNLNEKISLIYVYGAILSLAGVILDMWIPINKSLWTSSYSIYCAGMALLFLGTTIFIVDVKNFGKYFTTFLVYGMNAIAVFFLSGMLARVMMTYKLYYNGQVINFQNYLYLSIFQPIFGNINGSLGYALTYVAFWFVMMWILYKKKIFIKV